MDSLNLFVAEEAEPFEAAINNTNAFKESHTLAEVKVAPSTSPTAPPGGHPAASTVIFDDEIEDV